MTRIHRTKIESLVFLAAASGVALATLGALEYALLAPAACIASIELLASGGHKTALGLMLPWAVAVPVGFVVALWAVEHRHRFGGTGAWREALAQTLESLYVLRCLFAR